MQNKEKEIFMEPKKILTRESRIILYGAAAIGNLIYSYLEQNNYKVEAFIDKRGKEIGKKFGVPVFSIEDCHIKNKQDCIVIIAVKNVFEHELIAEQLKNLGFKYIIYKPYNTLDGQSTTDEQLLGDLWGTILDGKIEEIDVPELREIQHKFNAPTIIKKQGEEIVAYIPVTEIFTNDYNMQSPMEKWGDINILALFTHINFFKCMAGEKDAQVKDYVNEYCMFTAKLNGSVDITPAWIDNVIANRSMIYEQMNQSIILTPNFFLDNAPTARWNDEKKYFNLTSGKHRATFLASKGSMIIPLRISERDYKSFLNVPRIKLAVEAIKNNRMVEIEAPIFHPYFYTFMCTNRNWYNNVLSKLTLYFAKELYQKYEKIDFSKLSLKAFKQDDFLARHFIKMGAYANLNNYAVSKEINELLYCSDKNINDGIDMLEFCLMSIEKEGKFIHMLNNLTKARHIVIVERNKLLKLQDMKLDIDIVFIYSGYKDGRAHIVAEVKQG